MFDRAGFEAAMGVDNFAALAGMEVVKAEPGYAEVALPVTDKVRNGHGNLHGGALFSLADYAGAIASNMLGEATMAVNGGINFLRATREGKVTAVAKTVKNGRRVNFITVDIRNDAGDLVATFQGTAMRVERK